MPTRQDPPWLRYVPAVPRMIMRNFLPSASASPTPSARLAPKVGRYDQDPQFLGNPATEDTMPDDAILRGNAPGARLLPPVTRVAAQPQPTPKAPGGPSVTIGRGGPAIPWEPNRPQGISSNLLTGGYAPNFTAPPVQYGPRPDVGLGTNVYSGQPPFYSQAYGTYGNFDPSGKFVPVNGNVAGTAGIEGASGEVNGIPAASTAMIVVNGRPVPTATQPQALRPGATALDPSGGGRYGNAGQNYGMTSAQQGALLAWSQRAGGDITPLPDEIGYSGDNPDAVTLMPGSSSPYAARPSFRNATGFTNSAGLQRALAARAQKGR